MASVKKRRPDLGLVSEAAEAPETGRVSPAMFWLNPHCSDEGELGRLSGNGNDLESLDCDLSVELGFSSALNTCAPLSFLFRSLHRSLTIRALA